MHDATRRRSPRFIQGRSDSSEFSAPSDAARSDVGPFRIERRLYLHIVEHLQATLDEEGCGLIAFDDDLPVKVYPGTNVLRSDNRYRMDDLEVLRAVDEMDRNGWWLGAIYHSHPRSAPVPSTTDIREANWPHALMIIVSLLHGAADMRAYRVADDGYEDIGVEVYAERLPWLSSLRRRGRTVATLGEQQPGSHATAWRPVGARQPTIAMRGSESSDRARDRDALAAPAAHDFFDLDDDPDRRAVIGILGGMGPLATADLYRKIIEITPAARDQDHIPVLIYADPRVPDRSAALLQGGEDPTPWLVAGARALSDMGADFIVIPCNTAHAFLDAVRPAVDRPILSMIDAAADEAQALHGQAGVVGLLATSGTIASEMYQRAFRHRGLDAIVPEADTQRRCVSAAIDEIKAGRNTSAATALLVEACERLAQRGAGVILAACTEIPIALQQRHVKTPLIDATAALARTAVATALHLDETAQAGEPQWETSTVGWDLDKARTGAS
ncbi:MAG TPA: amino acid racemase [Thermomicrobiales bacterium]|nr:amino acid racemase [Thermomicrobiales bacterium]